MENQEFIDLNSLLTSNPSLQKEFVQRIKVVAKGEYIYIPDENLDAIYFVLKGKIKVGTFNDQDKEVITAILVEGDVFSELTLLGQGKRKDFAIASEESQIVSLKQDEINQMMKKFPELSILMMKIVGNRTFEIQDRLESLVFKDSKSRILEYIIKNVEKKGQRIGYEWVLRNYLTHQDIASLTSTSRQSVTMILNDLRNENIIQFDRKRLLIRDLDRLKSLVK
jgi:CRP/FNR family transcriptional regulator, cyclic AMP receptor protein